MEEKDFENEMKQYTEGVKESADAVTEATPEAPAAPAAETPAAPAAETPAAPAAETPAAPVDLDATQGIEEARMTEEAGTPKWHIESGKPEVELTLDPDEPKAEVRPEGPALDAEPEWQPEVSEAEAEFNEGEFAEGEASEEEYTEPQESDYYKSAETAYEQRQEEYRQQYQHKYDQQYNDSYDQQYAAEAYQRAAAAKHPGYITTRAVVLLLILAMLFTMLASVGITTAYSTYLSKKNAGNGHATNYTLSTSDESLSFKSIIQKTQDSVVSITTESVSNDMWLQNYVTQGAGSGVIIESDGYIITCEHVISGARKVTVTLRDGTEYKAKIIGADAGNDIAVIKIDAKNLQEATYGDSGKLEVGDQVVAIGNPLGTLSGTATTGIVSALNRNLQIDNRTLNLLQTDASINPGNSGGGLFDASGNLIGIVEAKSTGSDIDGLGFATPINKAAKIAKDIIEKGGDVNEGSQSSSQKVMIGIMVSPVDNATAQQFGYTHGGLLVKSVNSEEAISAGLRQDDIIYAADGKSVSNNNDLAKILATKKAGDKVKLSVARSDGSDTTVTTKLISAN